MKNLFLVFSAFFFSNYVQAEYNKCAKGTVWNGTQCVNICPEGYTWNEQGKCVRSAAAESPSAACKLPDDAYFSTTKTGCRYENTGIIFGRRSHSEMPYRSAEVYCKRIESGKKDWRLPTAEELEEITGDTIAGAYLNFRTDANFWTSDFIEDVKYRYDSHGDWFDTTVLVSNKMVNLYTGFTSWRSSKITENNKDSWNQSNAAHVVCVRKDP
jgi:hypothetical protein